MHVIEISRPQPADGWAVWTLIKRAGTLDLNTVYAYVLLCDYFRDTCRIARQGDQIIGFLSAFVTPQSPDSLFVWQVAVDPDYRGQGLAASMLHDVIDIERAKGRCRYVRATVSPCNEPSRRLFAALARSYGCAVDESVEQGYASAMLGDKGAHDDEPLLIIGPLQQKQEQKKTEE